MELIAFIIVVEIIKAISCYLDVLWGLRSRCINCLHSRKGKVYKISHIYREGNAVVDAITNEGYDIGDFTWWYYVPNNAMTFYYKNLQGKLEFIFVKSGVGPCTFIDAPCTFLFYFHLLIN